jgi:hypothetical protein
MGSNFGDYLNHIYISLKISLKKITSKVKGRIYNYYLSLYSKFYYDLYCVEDEYGHKEAIIERTVFRFWVYPSYWRYLFNKYLRKVRLKQYPANGCTNNLSKYLTCIIPHVHGIGHQLACWNTALIFANKYNFKFVHYPLSQDWEDFLGLGEGELNYFTLKNNQDIKIVDLPRIRRIDSKDIDGHYVFNEIINSEIINDKNILFRIKPDHAAYDQTPTAEIFRKKYWMKREKTPINTSLIKNKLNIACHIRRGDILQLNLNPTEFKNRWLANEYFIKVVQRIKSVLVEHNNIDIHLFSQGIISDFSEFEELKNVVYHLNEDPHTTFHSMVVADILILSPSSFSYKAGMISNGLKIAKYPWWHEIPENTEWIRANEDGDFNTQPLIKKYSNIANFYE